MPDNNPSAPAETVDDAPQTYDEQVEDISELISDPDEPDLHESEDHDAAAEGEDPDGAAEDVDEGDAEDPDGSAEPEYAGGRFAADNAKVKLDDGTTITIADLKRNNLYQRDYTKKTTELAAEREQITTRKSEVDQQAQALSQSLEYINWYAENYLPKAPEPFKGTPETDPIGYMRYMQSKEAYDQEQNLRSYFQQQTQALNQQKQQEYEQSRQQRLRTELDTLAAKDPLFRDRAKASAWFDRAVTLAGDYYGFTQQEIAGTMTDHRLVLALRDAFRYRQLKAKAPAVREEVGKKPVMASGGKRADPKVRVSKERQARSERLRREGTIEAGAASLMDLDL